MWIKTRDQGHGCIVIVTEHRLPGADGSPTIVEDFRTAQGPFEATQRWWEAMGWKPHEMASYFTVPLTASHEPPDFDAAMRHSLCPRGGCPDEILDD